MPPSAVKVPQGELTRISPQSARRLVWRARASRLWKRYLRVAATVAALLGNTILLIMYFVLLPPFAWLARRAARRERPGWTAVVPQRDDAMRRQY